MTIKAWINGYSGRMGQEIAEAAKDDQQLQIVGGSGHMLLKTQMRELEKYDVKDLAKALKEIDIIIDFSNIDGNHLLYQALESIEDKAVLIGTTGLSKERRDLWKKLAIDNSHRILFAPNTSLGVLLTMKVTQQLAATLHPRDFDIEIVESHHRHKSDSPSGTAKLLADRICDKVPLEIVTDRTGKRRDNELGIVALRGGSVFGEHEVRFMGDFEEISVTHRALSRSLFAKGSLILGHWLAQKKQNGHYGLVDIEINDLSF